MRKKIFIILFGIAALFLVGMLWYKLHKQSCSALYCNSKYAYELNYIPQGLVVHKFSDELVSFEEKDSQYGIFAVFVEESSASSIDQWLKDNASKERFEKRIKIDGYDAVVTHYISDEGDTPNEKRASFLKDGKLFYISARADYDKIWEGFRFAK